MPDDDSSEFAVNIRTPPGYSLAHTDQMVAQIEDRLRTIPEVRDLFTTVGDTNGDDRVTVAQVDRETVPARSAAPQPGSGDGRRAQIDGRISRRCASASIRSSRGSRAAIAKSRSNMTCAVPTSTRCATYADGLMTRLRKIPGIVDLDSSYEGGLPELQVNIDRTKSADLGVSVDDIAQTMRTMVQGDVITRFREGQDTYDVRLQLADKDRNNPGRGRRPDDSVEQGRTGAARQRRDADARNRAGANRSAGSPAQHLDRLQPRARIRDEQGDGRRHARGPRRFICRPATSRRSAGRARFTARWSPAS